MSRGDAARALRVLHLELWIPLLLGGFCLLLLAAVFALQRFDTQRRLRYFTEQVARETLLGAQLDIDAALRSKHGRSLDGIVSALGLHADVDYAVLLDSDGRVLAATRLAWKGQPAASVVADYLPPPAGSRAPMQAHGIQLRVDSASKRLIAEAPIAMSPSDWLAASRPGRLILAFDFAPRAATVERLMWERVWSLLGALLLALALLYLALRQLILRPVQVLAASMERIGGGDLDVAQPFRGRGEFLRLGAAMSGMAAELRARDVALRESEGRFRQLADGAFEAILVHEHGHILNANAAAERLWDVPAGSLVGRELLPLIAPHDRANVVRRTERELAGTWIVDVLDSHGQVVPTEVSARHHQADSRPLRVVSLRDLRERRAAAAEVQRLSNVDTVTGIANRRLLLDWVAEELVGSPGRDRRGALAVVNLDGFKSINDSLGMAAGDAVLRAVARRLSEGLGPNQHLARVNADTFALLFTGVEGESTTDASTVVGRLIEQKLADLARLLVIHEQILYLNASAGIVMVTAASTDAAEFLREAETAMHQAKQRGGARLHFFAPELQEAARRRLALRSDLRAAIHDRSEQLQLHFQPQVSADGRRFTGVEALLRWRHPQRGNVMPDEFIPEAESSGLIVPLGFWVLRQALDFLARLRERGAQASWATDLSLAVNVSSRQFREPDFALRVTEALDRAGIEPSALELELTESVLADDLEGTLAKMAALRRLGIRFALDDFGTGYSSLSYLKRLPIDTLKIDRSFTMDIDAPGAVDDSRRPAALIDTIITIAHQFDLQVLAEGVETASQRERLAGAGCDFFQGYLFGRPLPEADLHTWIDDFLGTVA